MKRFYTILACIAALLLGSVLASAADYGSPEGHAVNVVFSPERGAVAYMNGVLVTASGSATDVGFRATHQACMITLGGTAATSVTITGKRSTDTGTTYASVFSHTYTVATASTQAFDISYAGRYWQFTFDSKVGGGAYTAVTLKCDAKQ